MAKQINDTANVKNVKTREIMYKGKILPKQTPEERKQDYAEIRNVMGKYLRGMARGNSAG